MASGCGRRLRLWWLLHTVRLRLASLLLLFAGCHLRFPPSHVPAYQGLQQLCSYWYCRFRGNTHRMGHLFPVAHPIHCLQPTRLHALSHAMASADGLRSVYRTGSATYQFRKRHGRRLYRSGNGKSPQHIADGIGYGFRYSIRHTGVPHRQFCDRPYHDAPSCLLGICHSSSRIGHGLLHHLQHSAPSAAGSCCRRYHRCLFPQHCQPGSK